jgi:hypothetical protein
MVASVFRVLCVLQFRRQAAGAKEVLFLFFYLCRLSFRVTPWFGSLSRGRRWVSSVIYFVLSLVSLLLFLRCPIGIVLVVVLEGEYGFVFSRHGTEMISCTRGHERCVFYVLLGIVLVHRMNPK